MVFGLGKGPSREACMKYDLVVEETIETMNQPPIIIFASGFVAAVICCAWMLSIKGAAFNRAKDELEKRIEVLEAKVMSKEASLQDAQKQIKEHEDLSDANDGSVEILQSAVASKSPDNQPSSLAPKSSSLQPLHSQEPSAHEESTSGSGSSEEDSSSEEESADASGSDDSSEEEEWTTTVSATSMSDAQPSTLENRAAQLQTFAAFSAKSEQACGRNSLPSVASGIKIGGSISNGSSGKKRWDMVAKTVKNSAAGEGGFAGHYQRMAEKHEADKARSRTFL